MKMVTEYLAEAAKFEKLAADENDQQLKLSFFQQTAAYQKLAAKRAKELGVPPPPDRPLPAKPRDKSKALRSSFVQSGQPTRAILWQV